MKPSTKKKQDLFETVRFLGFLFLVFTGIHAAVFHFKGTSECFLEFPYCPEALIPYALTNGLLLLVIFLLSLATVAGSLILLFRKPIHSIGLSVGGMLIALGSANLFLDGTTPIQDHFRIPVAILNFIVAAVFIKKMITFLQKDPFQAQPNSNLIQKPGYRIYHKQKTHWSAINWLCGLGILLGLNIVSLADGVYSWGDTLSGLGIAAMLAGPLLLIGLIQSRRFMAFTEEGEFEFRIVMGQFMRYRKFPAKSVKELQLKWSIFVPDEKNTKDTWEALRTESQEETAKLTKNFKSLSEFSKKAEYKMKTKGGTEVHLFPFELNFIDASSNSLAKWKINLEDKEQIMLLKQLPDSTKITLDPKPNWLLPKNASR